MPRRKTTASKSASAPSATPPTASPFLTTAEAAQRLRVSVRTVERLRRKGEITAYRIGLLGLLRFRSEDIERLLVPEYGQERGEDLEEFISQRTKRG